MSDFKKRIGRNMVGLQQSLYVGEDLLGHLLSREILDFDLCDEIREQRVPKRKAVELLNILTRRGPGAEPAFIAALNATGQSHVVTILQQQPTPPQPHPVIQRTEVDSSNPRIHFTLERVSPDVAMGINSDPENYPMRRSPRGRAIILNNIEYGHSDHPDGQQQATDHDHGNRAGADIDEINFINLLEQLDFTVEIWKNIKTQDVLKKKLSVERKHEDHAKADAFIFVMMAHGERDQIILSTAEPPIKIADILKCFNGMKCEKLVGKPKLFFIQACQGDDRSLGVTGSDSLCQGGTTEADAKVGTMEDSKKMISEEKDFFLAYATLPGFRAFRNTLYGSWFIRSIVETFGKHCHEKHLLDLMTKVARGVGSQRDEQGHLQCCRRDDRMDRSLYFLPGYKE